MSTETSCDQGAGIVTLQASRALRNHGVTMRHDAYRSAHAAQRHPRQPDADRCARRAHRRAGRRASTPPPTSCSSCCASSTPKLAGITASCRAPTGSSWRTGIDMGAAREKVRVARALPGLPRISAALRCGSVSYAKVRAITRVATPETEQRLLDVALLGTASHVERIVRAWRRTDRVIAAQQADARHLSRHLTTWIDDDGMMVLRGRLTPELGAVLHRALEAAADQLFKEAKGAPQPGRLVEDVSWGQRRADALGPVGRSSSRRRPRRRNRRGPLPGGPARRGHGHRRWTPRSRSTGRWRWTTLPFTFPRKRRDDSPAMLASSTCTMTQTGTSWMSAARRGRFRPRFVAPSAPATRAADFRGAPPGAVTPTISNTGSRAGQPASPTSCCYAGAIIGSSTRAASLCNDSRIRRSPSSIPAATGFSVVPPQPRFDLANPLAPTMERLAANGITISPRSLPTWDGAPFNLVHAIDVLYVAPADNG